MRDAASSPPPRARLAAVGAVVLGLAASGLVAASGPSATAPDHAAARVVAAAREQVGDSYQWGGNGPDAWDCSGLVYMLWRAVGVASVPRVSRDQQAWAWPMRAADLRPGDLVFFGEPVNHVGIAVGGGKIIDASSANKKVLERAIWTSDVVRYGRVPRAGVAKPVPPVRAESVAKDPKGLNNYKRMGVVPAKGQAIKGKVPKDATLFVSRARRAVGRSWAKGGHGPRFDAAGLVRWAWASSGHRGLLPRTPGAIEKLARPVDVADLRPGNLVFYGQPAVHVGIYAGNGQMIDASKALGKVVVRPVFVSDTVRFGRLPTR